MKKIELLRSKFLSRLKDNSIKREIHLGFIASLMSISAKGWTSLITTEQFWMLRFRSILSIFFRNSQPEKSNNTLTQLVTFELRNFFQPV